MKERDKAWVVTVLMGLGHLRAAYPLRDLHHEGVVIYGSRRTTPRPEYGIWRRLRRMYYASSKAGAIPLLGRTLVALLLAIQRIPPYYPRSDQSRPTLAVKFLKRLIKKRGLCRSLRGTLASAPHPAVHTFYATAVAMDTLNEPGSCPPLGDQYLLICDADFNRVWVPQDPEASRLHYFAPCTQVRRRLLAYGVREDAIHMTGFPLPKENIGSEAHLEILKADLFKRLLRLDPSGKFFSYHEKSVLGWLGEDAVPSERERHFTVMFAIGGAGAQTEMVKKILAGPQGPHQKGHGPSDAFLRIQKPVFERVQGYLSAMGLRDELGRGLRHHPRPERLCAISIDSTNTCGAPTCFGRSRASWPFIAAWDCPS